MQADALKETLTAMLPEGVAVAVCAIGEGEAMPEELACIPRAVDKRRAEFSAGRHAAHEAMMALGVKPEPVLVDRDRSPIWPLGLTGSISHSAGLAVAVLGPMPKLRGIGVDIEPDEALPDDLWDSILDSDEGDWARAQPAPGQAARMIFCIKEAAHKAQYPQSKVILDFGDLTVEVAGDQFCARFQRRVAPFPLNHALTGEIRHSGGIIAAILTL